MYPPERQRQKEKEKEREAERERGKREIKLLTMHSYARWIANIMSNSCME
jgi:hypothetical protein